MILFRTKQGNLLNPEYIVTIERLAHDGVTDEHRVCIKVKMIDGQSWWLFDDDAEKLVRMMGYTL